MELTEEWLLEKGFNKIQRAAGPTGPYVQYRLPCPALYKTEFVVDFGCVYNPTGFLFNLELNTGSFLVDSLVLANIKTQEQVAQFVHLICGRSIEELGTTMVSEVCTKE